VDVLFIILLDLALVILHLLGFLTCHYVTVLFSVRFDTSILSGMSLVRAHLGTFGGLDDNGMMLGWLVFDFGMSAWLWFWRWAGGRVGEEKKALREIRRIVLFNISKRNTWGHWNDTHCTLVYLIESS